MNNVPTYYQKHTSYMELHKETPLRNTRKNPKLVFTSSSSTNVFSIISLTHIHAYFDVLLMILGYH